MKKLTTIFISVFLALLTCFSFGCKTNNAQPVEDSNVIIRNNYENGLSLQTTKIAPAQYSLYGISEQTETALLLEAHVEPATANVFLDWTVGWVDPEHMLAQNKTATDYVVVTPTSDGAASATVECLQEFGAQINVIVSVRTNPDVKAVCTVDYAARSGGCSVYCYASEENRISNFNDQDVTFLGYWYTLEFIHGASTSTYNDLQISGSLSLSEEFISNLQAQGLSTATINNVEYELTQGQYYWSINVKSRDFINLLDDDSKTAVLAVMEKIYMSKTDYTTEEKEIYIKFYNAVKNTIGHLYEIDINASSEVLSETKTYTLRVSLSDFLLDLPAESILLNKDNIIL